MQDVINLCTDALRLIFAGAVIYLFAAGITQAVLAVRYIMVRHIAENPPVVPERWPSVTVQIPLYNEPQVAERILRAVSELQYPTGLLEIQILDDSTDDTTDIVSRYLQSRGGGEPVKFELLRRSDRVGYKAGALAAAPLRSELVAILDADFLPDPDFLLRAVPYFADPKIGCVQASWAHLNRDQNVLTRLQAIGLDGHFVVEQVARNRSGWMSAFNGTCGIWRSSCIQSTGGWQSDTLTEDLDLSMRAQLAGWKLFYLPDLRVPGELPSVLPAVRTQQFRWSRGGAQTARKLLWSVLTAPLSAGKKWHACFQLNASAVWVFVLLAGCTGLLLSLIPQTAAPVWWPWLGHLSLAASAGILMFHITAVVFSGADPREVLLIPLYLVLAAGWTLYLARAVAGGWVGFSTPFIRTPKSGGFTVVPSGKYSGGAAELILGLIFLTVLLFGKADPVAIGFQVMLTAGLIVNGILLIFPAILYRYED